MDFPRKFPYDMVDMEDEKNAETVSFYSGVSSTRQYVYVGPKQFLLNTRYRRDAELLWNYKIRPDDIWITTFPRSGTTMTQDLIWLIANNFNYEGATERLVNRFPFFEYYLVAGYNEVNTPAYKFLEQLEERRFIKSHLPVSLLPVNVLECGAKLFYVARHPKDVIVSNFHFAKLLRCIDQDVPFDKYYDIFERNLTFWAPFWQHIQEGWELRNHPNVLFMFYENIVDNIPKAAKRIGEFLNVPVPDDELPKLTQYMSFDKFKKNPAVNFAGGEFVRRGSTKGWQKEFTPELRERAEKWIEENLRKTDLRFPEL